MSTKVCNAGMLNTYDVIQELPYNLISNNRYVVRFARTEEEMEAAQRLRFRVFNLELGEGLESSYESQRDADPYDAQCHHLMVVERGTDEVIGTYRMQTYRAARAKSGFYAENEFDLSSLPAQILIHSVEVGRACIEKEHRNGRALYLLWRGLAKYMVHTQSRYLFGCCSITSQDEMEAWTVKKYLIEKDHLHPIIKAGVNSGYRCSLAEIDPEAWKQVKLPQLFRLYMSLGAKVCSPPAIDRQFKTIDYLVILDTEALDERTRMLFFK